MTQHAGLTEEQWARHGRDRQILMIANEMNRAGKLKPHQAVTWSCSTRSSARPGR